MNSSITWFQLEKLIEISFQYGTCMPPLAMLKMFRRSIFWWKSYKFENKRDHSSGSQPFDVHVSPNQKLKFDFCAPLLTSRTPAGLKHLSTNSFAWRVQLTKLDVQSSFSLYEIIIYLFTNVIFLLKFVLKIWFNKPWSRCCATRRRSTEWRTNLGPDFDKKCNLNNNNNNKVILQAF